MAYRDVIWIPAVQQRIAANFWARDFRQILDAPYHNHNFGQVQDQFTYQPVEDVFSFIDMKLAIQKWGYELVSTTFGVPKQELVDAYTKGTKSFRFTINAEDIDPKIIEKYDIESIGVNFFDEVEQTGKKKEVKILTEELLLEKLSSEDLLSIVQDGGDFNVSAKKKWHQKLWVKGLIIFVSAGFSSGYSAAAETAASETALTLYGMGVTNSTALMAGYYVMYSAQYLMYVDMLTNGSISNSLFGGGQEQMAQSVAEDESARIEYVSDSIMGTMNEWMPGGDLYNSIYGGGELFNTTGSMEQSKFIGNKDKNFDMNLAYETGQTHDYYKMLGTDRIGTDSFSVFMFDKKLML